MRSAHVAISKGTEAYYELTSVHFALKTSLVRTTGWQLGSIPPSAHSGGTVNITELLKSSATTTTQRSNRRDLEFCCCRLIGPRETITPAATSP